MAVRFEVHVPESRERDVVQAVADATGITDEQGFDNLRGYLMAVLHETLHDLRHDGGEQERFANYVRHAETCKKQTAPVGGTVGRAS